MTQAVTQPSNSASVAHISPIWSRSATLIAEHGEGAYLHTADGRQLLDFTCGIGVTNTGHAHPRVVRAIQEQAPRLLHGQANIVLHRPMLRLVEELLTLVPPGLDSFYFSNSGAEIIEGAVKLAKHATGRTNVIVFSGSFHGRTHLTMAMSTAKPIYRRGYQPLVPGIFVAPYPHAYLARTTEEAVVETSLAELSRLFRTQTAPEETAAIVIEPVLGEGGYVPAPLSFLKRLRTMCDEFGILLVADEVQSGFGRTGRWFAIERSGVKPDILTMAKGIASGLPLSGMAASRELMARWIPGTHGGTYGGNAVACAAAVATIETIREERLLENAETLGPYLVARLRALQESHPEIGDVRGVGLMVACEFTDPGGRPWTQRAQAVVRAALEEGLMLLTCGSYDNVVRWIPPLVVDRGQLDDALDMFTRALEKAAN